jgi:hypothetical protein
MSRIHLVLACTALAVMLACSSSSTGTGSQADAIGGELVLADTPDTGAGDHGAADATDHGTADHADIADPGPTDHGTTDPGPTDHGTTDPGPTDPGPADVGPTDPGLTDPGPTDPGPTDLGPTDPGPAEIVAIDPGPTDPGPTDPGATEVAGDTSEITLQPGSVSVLSSGNALPPAWVVTDASDLKVDGTGTGMRTHVDQLVKLDLSTTVVTSPCPLSSTSGTTTYCDGFSAKDASSNEVVVDWYSFLGAHPACTMPPAGPLASITGVVEDLYDSSTKVDTWAIGLVDCSGVGQGTAYSGTGTPLPSTDIASLFASNPTTASVVTVRGVVIGTWTTTTGFFGFTMEDPAGGANSGMTVFKSSTSTTTATLPAIGDFVTASGPVKHMGSYSISIDL